MLVHISYEVLFYVKSFYVSTTLKSLLEFEKLVVNLLKTMLEAFNNEREEQILQQKWLHRSYSKHGS